MLTVLVLPNPQVNSQSNMSEIDNQVARVENFLIEQRHCAIGLPVGLVDLFLAKSTKAEKTRFLHDHVAHLFKKVDVDVVIFVGGIHTSWTQYYELVLGDWVVMAEKAGVQICESLDDFKELITLEPIQQTFLGKL